MSIALFGSQALHAIPIRVLAWDQEIAGRKLAIAQAKGNEIINGMHPARRTRIYQLTAGEVPATVAALDRLDKDGKPTTSNIVIPEGVQQPLLLLLPDPKSTTGLRLIILDDDAKNFSWGCTRFINASGKKLAFVHDKHVVPIPATWDPVQVNPGGDIRNLSVQLFLYDEPERPIYSGVWEQNPDERTLIFLVPGEDPKLSPVTMKMISEDRRLLAAIQAAGEKSLSGKSAQP